MESPISLEIVTPHFSIRIKSKVRQKAFCVMFGKIHGSNPGNELKLSYMFQESITHKYQNRPISSPPKSVIKTMEISDSRHFLSRRTHRCCQAVRFTVQNVFLMQNSKRWISPLTLIKRLHGADARPRLSASE